jgi:hypothetical protein
MLDVLSKDGMLIMLLAGAIWLLKCLHKRTIYEGFKESMLQLVCHNKRTEPTVLRPQSSSGHR